MKKFNKISKYFFILSGLFFLSLSSQACLTEYKDILDREEAPLHSLDRTWLSIKFKELNLDDRTKKGKKRRVLPAESPESYPPGDVGERREELMFYLFDKIKGWSITNIDIRHNSFRATASAEEELKRFMMVLLKRGCFQAQVTSLCFGGSYKSHEKMHGIPRVFEEWENLSNGTILQKGESAGSCEFILKYDPTDVKIKEVFGEVQVHSYEEVIKKGDKRLIGPERDSTPILALSDIPVDLDEDRAQKLGLGLENNFNIDVLDLSSFKKGTLSNDIYVRRLRDILWPGEQSFTLERVSVVKLDSTDGDYAFGRLLSNTFEGYENKFIYIPSEFLLDYRRRGVILPPVAEFHRRFYELGLLRAQPGPLDSVADYFW